MKIFGLELNSATQYFLMQFNIGLLTEIKKIFIHYSSHNSFLAQYEINIFKNKMF